MSDSRASKRRRQDSNEIHDSREVLETLPSTSSVNETIDLTNDEEAPVSIPPREKWLALIQKKEACQTENECLYQKRTEFDHQIMALVRFLQHGYSILSQIIATQNAWAAHYELLYHMAGTLQPVITDGLSAESFFIRINPFLGLYLKAKIDLGCDWDVQCCKCCGGCGQTFSEGSVRVGIIGRDSQDRIHWRHLFIRRVLALSDDQV